MRFMVRFESKLNPKTKQEADDIQADFATDLEGEFGMHNVTVWTTRNFKLDAIQHGLDAILADKLPERRERMKR